VNQVYKGVVEELTVLRRAPGGPLPAPVTIGTVWLEDGVRIVARVEAGVDPGAAVRLQYRDGVPVAGP
jgi:uncharacterized OB-fold protein